jgi:hypothetical protein
MQLGERFRRSYDDKLIILRPARFENIGDTLDQAISDVVFLGNTLSQRDHQVP